MKCMVNRVINIESPYEFNNHTVPRVSSILSSMINEEYLMNWANKLGMRHQSYQEVLNLAANKGTYTHNKIDKFLNNKDVSNYIVPNNCTKAVNNAFSAFMKWWDIINKNNNISIVMNEQSLSCNMFGGTLDLLLNINGDNYIIDFKTSNNPSYRYFLQLAAYEYLLEVNMNTNITGWIILLLNKNTPKFDEILVKRPENSDFMLNCKNTFLSFVEGYYNKLEVQHGSLQFFQ